MSWVNEAVFYHIYPMGFCGAPRQNEGGDTVPRLKKILQWIPHLRELGVDAVYLGPVFESAEHGYDTSDYYKIDRRLGDNDTMKEVCQKLHENGIRVILDGVFNHVGREFWAFRDVREKLSQSPYCDWFQGLNFGGRSPCGDPFWYEGWHGHYNLVKLNLQNPQVVEHLLGAVEMWRKEFSIDGLRLDAADCIHPDFFKRLRAFCKGFDPDFWLMGEIIHGDYNRWANPEMLDSVTNYECHKGLYSSHNTKNYFEIAYSLNRQFGNGGIYKNLCLYNFVDNHDVNRLASCLKNPRHLFNTYTLLYTMPGAPSVYYGSEWGIAGTRSNTSDADLRPCIDLGEVPDANEELCAHVKRLGRLRHQLPALTHGGYEQAMIKNEQFVFCRMAGNQRVYVALNLSDHSEWVEFRGQTGKLVDLFDGGKSFETNDGNFKLELPAFGARLLVNEETLIEQNLDPAAYRPEPVEQAAPVKAPEAPREPEPVCPPDLVEAPARPPEPVKEPEPAAQPAVSHRTPAPPSPDAEPYVAPGIYRHFKGGLYEVIGAARNSETDEPLVVYRSLYGEYGLWVRPLEMFTEEVERDGVKKPRFTLLTKF